MFLYLIIGFIILIFIMYFIVKDKHINIKLKSKNKDPSIDQFLNLMSSFANSLIDKIIYFIDIRFKEDGNIMYYVNGSKVIDIDNINLSWVIIDYIKSDKTHTQVKLPSYAVFLTPQEANAFLNGEFLLSELSYIEEIQ